ncbi:hypothetical protein IGI04_007292, partial [Brassica rapa subsp. trilocularis]
SFPLYLSLESPNSNLEEKKKIRASLHVRIATMMNLDFPDGTSPPSHIPRSRKSPRKNASKPSPPPPPPPPEPATEHVTNKKKKKKKALASSSRIWNEEDELTVLKGLVEYQAQKGNEPKSNWGDFYRFVGGSITGKFSKEQVLTKIRKLKAKFIANMQKANTSKSEAFLLSKSIWGPQSESDQSADHTKSGEEMANHEPSNNEVTKADFEGNEESWVVRDAFETMVSKGLSDYQKKLQLEKLMNLGSCKRRELSDEWKELCAEERLLNAVASRDLRVSKTLRVPLLLYSNQNNSYEKELFRLSTIIWAKNETEDASSENRQDQAKVLVLNKDVPLVEQKRVNDTRIDIKIRARKCRENSTEDAVSELKTFGAQRRKELAGDWKALLNEEMELHMQKLTFLQSFLVHEFL